MKEQPRAYLSYAFSQNTQNVKTANPAKTCVRKILRTRRCRRKFIKKLLPEKRKKNM